MDAEFEKLLSTQWRFLHQDWPIVERTKFHRTEIKDVQEIQRVKDFVQHKLGVIPVFFFLTTIFGVRSYPGPYRNVEKQTPLTTDLIIINVNKSTAGKRLAVLQGVYPISHPTNSRIAISPIYDD